MSVQEAFFALIREIRLRKPDAKLQLRPPATEEMIRKAETSLGFDLPEALVDVLMLHDGQDEYVNKQQCEPLLLPVAVRNGADVSWGYSLLPVAQIASRTNRWRQGLEIAHDRYGFDVCANGTEIFGPTTYHINRLIIGEFADSIALDLEPARGGKQWQVLTIDHDPPAITVVADGLESHFRLLTRALRNIKQDG